MGKEAYFVAHSETSVIGCRTPEIGYICYIAQIDEIEPAVEDEPARLPMIRYEIWIVPAGKGEGVEEEEGEDYHDAAEDAPPKLLVHHGFDVLFACY